MRLESTCTYIHQIAISQDIQHGVHMGLAGEVKSGSDMPIWCDDSPREMRIQAIYDVRLPVDYGVL